VLEQCRFANPATPEDQHAALLANMLEQSLRFEFSSGEDGHPRQGKT
jgi:hypothetical protein